MNAYDWTVYVDDNFHFMDETERYIEGNFSTYDAAVATCRNIIDRFLLSTEAATAEALYDLYKMFGEDPWIEGPIPCREGQSFRAFDYALRRCSELHSKAL